MTLAEDFLKDELFTSLLETSCELVWTYNFDSRRFSCFASPEKRAKYFIPDNATEDYLIQLIHHEDRERTVQRTRDAIRDRTATAKHHEFRILLKRETLTIREKFRVLRDAHGNVTTAIGLWKDVSAEREKEEHQQRMLREKEEELREARRRLVDLESKTANREFILRESQRLAKIGSWEYDTHRRTVLWSEEMYSIYGVDKSFDINDHEEVLSLYHPLSRPVVRDSFESVLQRSHFDVVAEVLTPIGYRKWVRLIGHARQGKIIGLSYDITYFKEAETLLRTSEEKFSKAFHNNPDPMAIVREEDMVVVDVSSKVDALLGYGRHEVLGRRAHQLKLFAAQTERALVRDGIASSVSSEVECGLKTKDGATVYALLSTTKIEIRGVRYLLFVLKNITSRKVAERELLQVQGRIAESKMMALRSAMNPHFIFNALNSIQYFIAGNERRNAINYLSMFSKLVRGILSHSVQNKVRLADELDLLTHYVYLELLRFENKFDFELETDPSIDPDAIEIPSLLIQPYVENAILHGLYNKEGRGQLKIRVEPQDEGIAVTIQDNGVGRAAAALLKDRAFPKHKSLGTLLTEERLKLVNRFGKVSVETRDLFEGEIPSGTKVRIWIAV